MKVHSWNKRRNLNFVSLADRVASCAVVTAQPVIMR
jgi:hypothetical protein